MQLFADRTIQKYYPVAFLIIISLMIAGLTRMETPPEPVPASAADSVFSAERAFTDLSDLLKENVPHPPGSAANKVIRDRITEKMIARGFDVSIQADFACQRRWRSCSNVENIVATKAGSSGKHAILVMAHYDSVPASAAATDDGYGVAAMLETARALSKDGTYENDLIFLFTDAEETGLLGAEAFAANHPLMEKVAIIVNIESRGTSGTSAMFETGADNNMLLDIYQHAVSRPVANSVTYEVYKRMPNDTDYTVFKERGTPGLNFASSASASRYHSVLDDLTHVNQGTLQHHGDNSLNMVRALANMNLDALATRSGDATYFDFYSFFLVKWPSSANGPLSILGTLIIIGLIFQNVKQQSISLKNTLWSLAFSLLSVVALLGITFLLGFPLGHWMDLHLLDHLNPWPGKIAILAASFLAILTVARFSHSRTTLQSQLLVIWLLIALSAVALSYTVTGATYIALAPLLAFMAGLAADYIKSKRTYRPIDFVISAHAGFLMAAYLGLYHFNLLELVFSFDNSALRATTLLFMAFALLPIVQRYYAASLSSYRSHLITLAAVLVVGGGVSMSIPGYSAEKPEPLNIIYVENADTKEAFFTLEPYMSWWKGTPSKHYETMGFPNEKKEYPLPVRSGKMRPQKTATFIGLTPPALEIVTDVTSNGERHIEAEIAAGHGGHEIYLTFSENAPIQAITIKGEVPVLESHYERPRINIGLAGTQEDTFRVKMTVAAEQPFTITLSEESIAPLNTAEAQALHALRPSYTKPNQWGDRSIVFRKIEF